MSPLFLLAVDNMPFELAYQLLWGGQSNIVKSKEQKGKPTDLRLGVKEKSLPFQIMGGVKKKKK